ncbi:MAG TPA: hypothetical protein VLA28_06330 [Afifellaceae bacterium]|nr:hypothetical protein [Afifellaceae bacterium]
MSAGLVIGATSAAMAGEADVVKVAVSETAPGSFRFDVTVRHGDEGWDHYANAWQVLAPDGGILGERVLLHPHDTEQPFTRSLSGVAISGEIKTVIIRARDSVHDFGGKEMSIDLPGR